MKPFLKWVGGKTQIIEHVLKEFPKEMNNYYEPFLGGGSVLLQLLERKEVKIKQNIYASDLNKNLIELYKSIQSNPNILIQELRILVNEMENINGDIVNRKPSNKEEALTSKESYYYWIRSLYNREPSPAMFLFLNKNCFRGVHREGPNGFNVPYGNYKNPNVFDSEHILKISSLIKNVVFSCDSYESVLKNVKENDFVYLDPPYAPSDEKSFVSYTKGGFNYENHMKLFSMCKNINFVMSNSDVKLVIDNFKGYSVTVIECKRRINSIPFSLKNSINLFFCGVVFSPKMFPNCSLHFFSEPPMQRIFKGFPYSCGMSAYLKGHPRIFSSAVPSVKYVPVLTSHM